MMKASEMRIGNYINNDGVVVQVDSRTIFDIDTDTDSAIKYKAIPITEQWLAKFGFIIDGVWCDYLLNITNNRMIGYSLSLIHI